jgi:hypothetical protein
MNRLARPKALQVIGQSFGRSIALERVLFQTLQTNRLQVSRQTGLKTVRRNRLLAAHQVKRFQGQNHFECH